MDWRKIMYLEKLCLSKTKLKTFESRLSKEVFNGDKVKFRYDEESDSFYVSVNDKRKLDVGDFFTIDFDENDLNLSSAKKFTLTCNIIMSELFTQKDCNDDNIYLTSAKDHFKKLRMKEENALFPYFINSDVDRNSEYCRWVLKPMHYYSHVECGLRERLKRDLVK